MNIIVNRMYDVLYESNSNNLKEVMEEAVAAGVSLAGALLSYARLENAKLRNADLRQANLRSGILYGADLTGANLKDADLAGAVLSKACLRGADLTGAYLNGASMTGTDTFGAIIYDEVLSKTPIIINYLPFHVLITDNYMQIFHYRHTHEHWAAFTENDIDQNLLEFWQKWRDPLLAICKHQNAS